MYPRDQHIWAARELEYILDKYKYYFCSEIINTMNFFIYGLDESYRLGEAFDSLLEPNEELGQKFRLGQIPNGINNLRFNFISDRLEPRFITEYNLMDCFLYFYDIREMEVYDPIEGYPAYVPYPCLSTHIRYLPNRDIARHDILLASKSIKYFYDNKKYLIDSKKYNYDQLLTITSNDLDNLKKNENYKQIKEVYLAYKEIIKILNKYTNLNDDEHFCSDSLYTIRVCLKIVCNDIESIIDFIMYLYRMGNKSIEITGNNLFDYLIISYKHKSKIWRLIKNSKDVNLQSIPDNLAWYDTRYLPYREIMEEDLIIANESIKNFYNITSKNSC